MLRAYAGETAPTNRADRSGEDLLLSPTPVEELDDRTAGSEAFVQLVNFIATLDILTNPTAA